MMGWQTPYKSKKDMRASAVGKAPAFLETSMFGAEYHGDGTYPVVGPTPHLRKWYASVTVEGGIVTGVK